MQIKILFPFNGQNDLENSSLSYKILSSDPDILEALNTTASRDSLLDIV